MYFDLYRCRIEKKRFCFSVARLTTFPLCRWCCMHCDLHHRLNLRAQLLCFWLDRNSFMWCCGQLQVHTSRISASYFECYTLGESCCWNLRIALIHRCIASCESFRDEFITVNGSCSIRSPQSWCTMEPEDLDMIMSFDTNCSITVTQWDKQGDMEIPTERYSENIVLYKSSTSLYLL